jgi:hypothetical protein
VVRGAAADGWASFRKKGEKIERKNRAQKKGLAPMSMTDLEGIGALMHAVSLLGRRSFFLAAAAFF